jgi:phosphatidate cytidylyltransferase
MQRIVTAVVAAPIFLAAAFLLPPGWFFVLVALAIDGAAVEFVRLLRPAAPRAPLALVPVLAPLTALAAELAPQSGAGAEALLLAAGLAAAVGTGSAVLFARTPVEETLPAVGALAFGVVYFALPIVACSRLQRLDPWLFVLLLAVVWAGDTAAYYVGSRFGRHRLAPVVSPKKSWEGAAAGLAAALAATAVWELGRLGTVSPEVIALGAVTAVAGQVGDLVESMFKRGSGVKDSGTVLPGHGGVLDRVDALLFAAPVLLAGVALIGPERLRP